MIDTIRQLVRSTLWDIGLWSQDAEELMMGTGAVESNYQHLRQIYGPARSFWQIEPETALDNRDNYLIYRLERMESICKTCMIDIDMLKEADENQMSRLLEINIAFAICMARIKYFRIPFPLPKTVDEQADYWLKYYNAGGKGTLEKYIETNKMLN